jgi:DNA-binding PadR family transcriptional regulator
MLAVMRLGDDAYGVPICRLLEDATGRNAAVSSVYATLERLEAKGWVRCDLGEPTAERGGRAKKYCRVTPAGTRAVKAGQRALTTLWHGLPQLQRERP